MEREVEVTGEVAVPFPRVCQMFLEAAVLVGRSYSGGHELAARAPAASDPDLTSARTRPDAGVPGTEIYLG